MTTEAATATRPAIDLARVRAWLPKYGVYVAIGVLVLYNVLFTPNFLTWSNLRIQLIQVAPIVIVALGMALVIGTEGIDLSVGSVMALAAALIPLYLGYGVVAAILVSLVAGVVVGLVNGTLVARVGLQPIVATLALFVGGRGLALVISDGQLKDVRNDDLIYLGSGDFLGIPMLVWIAALLVLVVAFVVRRTVFGRRLLAIGGNRPATELAGVPVKRVLITVYVLCSVLASIAGLLAVARIQSSDASAVGLLIELSAITAVVVGGTPLTGGKVRVLGTVAGALLMQLVVATMIKHNLQPSTTEMVQAVIILIAVYVARERKSR
ncbi:sugar ABC transporter permease [Actinoplanes sp. NBRC 14428]|uniref:Monosaccharide ABC transporter membrane protein (CUT2 family) n=1 Tax=Pseudosporangium ferrugineum TaxID=439699 RepID=A0A2T0S7Z1_9ACTN|nr:ABC transporter permease [Pseudosporangium ferrugineum]PRY29538.1 monosaccharide ABC transporter membrane protein (CUT2 family) [Pseudosporangium ferrugineum]BCJ52720.1 sugar ABC transporter permease [Actinoplanes sp. NBRC 14428]